MCIPSFIKIRSGVSEPQCVEICFFPLLWLLAFTTACTCVWIDASCVVPATNTAVHVLSGQFLNDVGRHGDSAVSYVTASQLSHDDFELIFNTASALRSDVTSLLSGSFLTGLPECEIVVVA